MSVYIRKSISVGPFRFNLSKSGVGVSVGVKGFRIGSGPKGNYVHMGANGIYYRATIPTNRKNTKVNDSEQVAYHSVQECSTHEELKEIESAEVSQIIDSSSEELLDELNNKRKKIRKWPFILVFGAMIFYILIQAGAKDSSLMLAFMMGVAVISFFYSRDLLSKTTVLFYEFEPELEHKYEQLLEAAEQLSNCSKCWHVSASGKVIDKKYHAGASNLVERKITEINITEPPYIKTNVKTVSIGVGKQVLHFFPDRVLVYDKSGIGAVNYNDLIIGVSDRQFVENGNVPSDAVVVDRTWKYVNKNGGPDRRFKDNHELPVCLYQEMYLTNSTGLNELLQFSSVGVAEHFKLVLNKLKRSLSKDN